MDQQPGMPVHPSPADIARYNNWARLHNRPLFGAMAAPAAPAAPAAAPAPAAAAAAAHQPNVVYENIGRGGAAAAGWQGAIRRYTFTNLSGPELMPLLQMAAARPFYDQLQAANLPFRVMLSFELNLIKPTTDEDVSFHGKIPAVSCNDVYGAAMSWDAFMHIHIEAMHARVEQLDGLPSGLALDRIIALQLTFVPSTHILAYRAHLQGGVYIPRPPELANKHCMINISTT